jgi:hypothetical protein
VIDFASKINEFAILTLNVASNGMVDLQEEQLFNEDTHSSRSVTALAEAIKKHTTLTSLDISDNK